MSTFVPAPGPVSTVSVAGLSKKNPAVSNVAIGPVETTITIALTTGKFLLRSRISTPLQIRTTSGGAYLTLNPGCFWTEDTAALPTPLALYITAPLGSSTLEVIEWERV